MSQQEISQYNRRKVNTVSGFPINHVFPTRFVSEFTYLDISASLMGSWPWHEGWGLVSSGMVILRVDISGCTCPGKFTGANTISVQGSRWPWAGHAQLSFFFFFLLGFLSNQVYRTYVSREIKLLIIHLCKQHNYRDVNVSVAPGKFSEFLSWIIGSLLHLLT